MRTALVKAIALPAVQRRLMVITRTCVSLRRAEFMFYACVTSLYNIPRVLHFSEFISLVFLEYQTVPISASLRSALQSLSLHILHSTIIMLQQEY